MGRSVGSQAYSRHESVLICSYVLKKLDQGQQYFYPGSPVTWQRASAEGLLPDRTISSLRRHFCQQVMPKLHTIVTNPMDADRLSNCLRYTQRPNCPLLRLAKEITKSIRTATVKIENPKYCVEKSKNLIDKTQNHEKYRYKKNICYSKAEFFEMVEFVAKKLRDWPKDKLDGMAGAQCVKLWRLAKEEGLFPQRAANGLYATFRRKILPNVRKFAKKREDADLIRSNLLKLRIGAPRGGRSLRDKIQNMGGYKDTKKNPLLSRRRRIRKKNCAYSHEECVAICSYILRKLDSGQQYFYASSHSVWRQASAEGLLPCRTSAGLRFYFGTKIRPNLEKFVEDPNDLERLKACLCYMGTNTTSDLWKFLVKNDKRRSTTTKSGVFHETAEKPKMSNILDQIAPKSASSTFSDRSAPGNHVFTETEVETMSDDDVQIDDAAAPSLSAKNRFPKNSGISGHFCNDASNQIRDRGESSKSPAEKISSLETLRNENVQLKQEKLSNYRLIVNLTRQLDYHQRETVRRQKDCYQLKSHSIELENEIVRLNIRLSTYANYLPFLPRNF